MGVAEKWSKYGNDNQSLIMYEASVFLAITRTWHIGTGIKGRQQRNLLLHITLKVKTSIIGVDLVIWCCVVVQNDPIDCYYHYSFQCHTNIHDIYLYLHVYRTDKLFHVNF